ncbi:unnamed protein product [Agarophyton chilense]
MNSAEDPGLRQKLSEQLSLSKKEMSACVLDSSWSMTIPAVLLSIPIAVRIKSYSPLVFVAITASGFDYYLGFRKCEEIRRNMVEIKRRIAEIDNPDFSINEREAPD